ncbi:MAG: futalosine hydrolase [Candidatus Baltobacteraceae bacterium]
MILVVCALAAELPGFVRPEGVEVLACGIGPIEAAAETARMLASARFRCALNVGIAGAFEGRGRVGEAVVVAEERFAGLTLESGAALTLPNGSRVVERAHADDALLARLAGLPYRIITGLTVATVTSTDETAARLLATYDADVESMEGFAVLRACALAGVPALELRGVSNRVGDRATSGWDFGAGAGAAVKALGATLARLGGAS